jgi:RNA polymerase sigma-54 factor
MKLRPMILKDVSEITGLDISTISRVANSKYCQTDFGVFSLRHFFSERFAMEGGEEVSTRYVMKTLQEYIDNEDKSNPLGDEVLRQMLAEKGYHLARRTVAKYREQMNIPVARMRKEL